MKRWSSLLYVVLWAMALCTPLMAQTIQVTDDSAHTLTLSAPAQRIVALAPNLTDMLRAIGADTQIVGVSRHSADARWPVVGDAHSLNLEAIVALKPDLVLVWQSGTPQRQREALKRLGLPVYESESRNVEGMAQTLRRLGTLTGRSAAAEAVASKVQDDWRALQARYPRAAPVRVFYQVWQAPLMTFNGQHLVSQAIRACGGAGGFDTQGGLTVTVNREAVLAFNPQLLITGDSPTDLKAWQAWPQLEAVRLGQLVRVDGTALTRMSPGFVAAAAELCAAVDAARRQIGAQSRGNQTP